MADNNHVKIIFGTALLAGTLDILSAIISTYVRFGIGPGRVFKYIASGAFGSDAFSGGIEMIIAGIFFHYFIAGAWTTIFFVVYSKLKLSGINKILVGCLYGVIVWLMMNLVVLPLSNVPGINFSFLNICLGVLYLMLFIGLPVSLLYHKHYSNS